MDDGNLLYRKIITYIKDEITKGNLNEGDRLPTEAELSEMFSVSRITSKRALEDLRNEGLIYRVRGSGSYVKEQRSLSDVREAAPARERVTNGIDYNKIICMVIPFDTKNGGMMDMISSVSNALEKTDYVLSIYCVNDDVEKERDTLTGLYEKQVGGIIYYPISDRKNIDVINMLYLHGFPIVTIDKYFESVPINYVVSDNMGGAYIATKHLIELGHTKIAFLSDHMIEDATSIRNRYFGYCKALNEADLPIDEKLVKNGDLFNIEFDKCVSIIRELIGYGMTAACSINDYVATMTIRCIMSLGLSVPDDISVTGFDDLDFARMFSVPITTVRQNMVQIGYEAVNLIIESIRNGRNIKAKKVVPVELVVRETTAVNQIKQREDMKNELNKNNPYPQPRGHHA